MAGMEGLGRVFDIVPAAKTLYISMQNCSGIAFVCTSANSDSFNFQEAQDSAGTGAKDIGAVIKQYYTNADTDGSLHYSKTAQAAADETGTVATGSFVVVHILAPMLDDGFDYVSCTPSSTGTVIAVLYDLLVQRTPASMPLPGE